MSYFLCITINNCFPLLMWLCSLFFFIEFDLLLYIWLNTSYAFWFPWCRISTFSLLIILLCHVPWAFQMMWLDVGNLFRCNSCMWTILVQCRKILSIFGVHVPHFHLLYFLRYDGCWSHTFSTLGCRHLFCILLSVESPFGISCPTTGK